MGLPMEVGIQVATNENDIMDRKVFVYWHKISLSIAPLLFILQML